MAGLCHCLPTALWSCLPFPASCSFLLLLEARLPLARPVLWIFVMHDYEKQRREKEAEGCGWGDSFLITVLARAKWIAKKSRFKVYHCGHRGIKKCKKDRTESIWRILKFVRLFLWPRHCLVTRQAVAQKEMTQNTRKMSGKCKSLKGCFTTNFCLLRILRKNKQLCQRSKYTSVVFKHFSGSIKPRNDDVLHIAPGDICIFILFYKSKS